jgi:hypothetical protein
MENILWKYLLNSKWLSDINKVKTQNISINCHTKNSLVFVRLALKFCDFIILQWVYFVLFSEMKET